MIYDERTEGIKYAAANVVGNGAAVECQPAVIEDATAVCSVKNVRAVLNNKAVDDRCDEIRSG